jgi:hypothetical protein
VQGNDKIAASRDVRAAVAEIRSEGDPCFHGGIVPVLAACAKRLPAFAGASGAW